MKLASRLACCLLVACFSGKGVTAFVASSSDTCAAWSSKPPLLSTMRLSSSYFGWFSGSAADDNKSVDDKLKAGGKLGGVVSMMKNMEDLQTTQRYGKITAALMNELESTTVEGASPDNKVKVVFNCQQKPTAISIDEAYFEGSDVADLKSAVLAAMEEAYEKSVEKMDDKMKSFYKDVGL
jgi:DNA-binding YbaB/EbfC family protein